MCKILCNILTDMIVSHCRQQKTNITLKPSTYEQGKKVITFTQMLWPIKTTTSTRLPLEKTRMKCLSVMLYFDTWFNVRTTCKPFVGLLEYCMAEITIHASHNMVGLEQIVSSDLFRGTQWKSV